MDDDAAVQKFAEELEAGAIPRLRRLTYAEVTPQGPVLESWGPPVHSELVRLSDRRKRSGGLLAYDL